MKLTLGPRGLEVLCEIEVERIIGTALQLLDKGGVLVENEKMLQRFQEAGARVNYPAQRVAFPRAMVECYLDRVEKVEWSEREVGFGAVAEIYQGYFLDPQDGAMKEWDEQKLVNYIKLARALKDIDDVYMLGCPLKETPVQLQPLYEKLYVWKYGIGGGASLWETALCPNVLEMYRIYADTQGKDVKELFQGTVYLISPLKLGSVEAEQFMYFQERGLRVNVGYNGALGGGMPVTLAGGLVVQLAEAIFVSLLNHVFFGTASLGLDTSISVMDMSTGAQQYGRPEKSIANLAMAQIARKLKVHCSGHTGLSDAKVPGCEAGMQKATSAIFGAAACGYGYVAAGLLSTDEIFSPVQMIFDSELTGSLRRIGAGMETGEEDLALETLLEEGPGATFIGTEHTAFNFRESLWMPMTWSKAMFGVWDREGRRNDTDIAREKYFSIIKDGKPLPACISEDTERRLMEVIGRCQR